jgi:predicted membrane protein
MEPKVCYLFIFAVTMSSLGGLVVATIVKEYSGNFANVITAIASSFLFPDKFQLTRYILTSLFLLLTGIYLYEMFKIAPTLSPAKRASASGPEDVEEEEEEEDVLAVVSEKKALLREDEENTENVVKT